MNTTTHSLVIGEIRAEIARQGRRLNDVAEAVGLSESQMSRRMSGRQDFTLAEVLAIAEALAVSPAVIISRAQDAAA